MSSAAARAIADRLGNAQQDGTVIRFEVDRSTRYNPIAVYRESSLSWAVTGQGVVWGNRMILAERFGDFEVIWSPNPAWQEANRVSGNREPESDDARILADVRKVLAEAVKENDEAGSDIEYVAFNGLVANLQAISGLEPVPGPRDVFEAGAGEKYRDMISEAGSLWASADAIDFAENPEYLRGQVELIGRCVTWPPDSEAEEIYAWIESDIRAAAAAQSTTS